MDAILSEKNKTDSKQNLTKNSQPNIETMN